MKFRYSYIIYKIYSWTAGKKDDTPIGNTILTLAIVHFFHLLTILYFIDRIITPLNWLDKVNRTYLLVGLLLYVILFYVMVYNKKRWDAYIEQYSSEGEQDKKRGNVIVIAYLIGSILLFFISLPVLFTIGKHLHGQ